MITAYHRPKTIPEALDLLKQNDTFPLGGGTLLSQLKSDSIEVVDLQSLNLDTLKKKGNYVVVGATVTLQQILKSSHTPEDLKSALQLEAPLNIRNAATIAGALVAGDGRSPFVTALLALDAKLTTQPDDEQIEIGNFLATRDKGSIPNLISAITLPTHAVLAFEHVGRTPKDKPIVCAALASWPSGRSRLALGGYGVVPLLAMDGTEPEGLESAARNAFKEAKDDWASADYRMDVAATLAMRCLEKIQRD
ncbi:MAG: FAD binding domain-containing protein [Anaerolineae bacterium]|nr:FAD binding domain-containing protein [Anaerolineae bacterium]MDK1117871.1 FAD binding domain-containing protein [Anaerolineae bacterium]